MDQLLAKIRDLEKEAINVAKQQQDSARKADTKEDPLSFAHWVQCSRLAAGTWNAGPLVVLSLFDGIGGIWNALATLGIPFSGYSSEVSNAAKQVLKARFPSVRHVGDITTLQSNSIPEKVDLIVGGFPCQDLSSMGHRRGLHGQRSKLFFDMLRAIKMFRPTWFLAENVASMSWQDRDEISKHLRTIPIEIDSQELTPSRRRRIYWSNIPYPKKLPKLKDHESSSLQSVLKSATALDSKIGCILSQNMVKTGYGSLDLVMNNATGTLRYISVSEVEKALGYPAGYTDVNFRTANRKEIVSSTTYEKAVEDFVVKRSAGDKTLRDRKIMKSSSSITVREERIVKSSVQTVSVHDIASKADGANRTIRWHLLGNTFSVNVIIYLLTPLLERAGRSILKPIALPKSVKEHECSAMDPGEVWALYNSHERPNWYALIDSRTGDRFTQNPGKKKTPIRIEVRFLEMTEEYAADEPDEWDTVSGTGLYRVRKLTDSQNSWVAFSHRMTNFFRFDDHFFIFPNKDEVWAVCDHNANSRYLVYVLESFVDRNKAKQGRPGKESFKARCRLLQRVETEFYRIQEKEVDYSELAIFAFRAPYIFKNERNLLKIELTSRQRAAKPDLFKKMNKRKRVYSDSGDSSQSEDDDHDLATDHAMAEIMGGGDDAAGLANCLDRSP